MRTIKITESAIHRIAEINAGVYPEIQVVPTYYVDFQDPSITNQIVTEPVLRSVMTFVTPERNSEWSKIALLEF